MAHTVSLQCVPKSGTYDTCLRNCKVVRDIVQTGVHYGVLNAYYKTHHQRSPCFSSTRSAILSDTGEACTQRGLSHLSSSHCLARYS